MDEARVTLSGRLTRVRMLGVQMKEGEMTDLDTELRALHPNTHFHFRPSPFSGYRLCTLRGCDWGSRIYPTIQLLDKHKEEAYQKLCMKVDRQRRL